MSSLGNQWRVIRHYLSLTNLNAEVEKLVQKIKPATPEQWDNLVKKLESTLWTKQDTKKTVNQNVLKATTVEETNVESKTTTKEKDDKNEEKLESDTHSVGSDISFDSIMQGLKLKKDLHFGKISEPSWKNNKPTVSKENNTLILDNKITSIHARTAYVISALVTAETTDSLRRRAEHFVDHLRDFPEARDYAIKEGAVRALLRVQHRLPEHEAELRGVINEALALAGQGGALRARGPRVLALDGGGVRGLAAVAVLRRLEDRARRPLHQLFDLIVGVSTGAIIAAIIGSGAGNLETANEMYLTLSKKMFGNTSIIGGTSRLVWSHSYYDTAAWEQLLQECLGPVHLTHINRRNAPKVALVSCAVGPGGQPRPFVFRSYSAGYRRRPVYAGTCRARLWQAVRASAAAPTYFTEYTLDGQLHQDGGMVVNNPAGVALGEARLLYGDVRHATLVSVGTGRALPAGAGPAAGAGPGAGAGAGPAGGGAATSWRDKLGLMLASATDTDGVHHLLHDLLPAGSYYRLNPPLLDSCAMDEVDEGRLQALLRDTEHYCHRNSMKLEEVARRLTQKRTVVQRVADYVHHRALLLGAINPH